MGEAKRREASDVLFERHPLVSKLLYRKRLRELLKKENMMDLRGFVKETVHEAELGVAAVHGVGVASITVDAVAYPVRVEGVDVLAVKLGEGQHVRIKVRPRKSKRRKK